MKTVVILSDDHETLVRLSEAVAEEGYRARAHALDENMLTFILDNSPAAVILDAKFTWEELAPIITNLKREFQLRNTAIIATVETLEPTERLPRLTVHNLYLVERPVRSTDLIAQLSRAIGRP